jgi:hypothetical protein
VNHGHLETTDSLTTNGGYVLGGTLVISLGRGRERYVYEGESERRKERGRRDERREKIEDGRKEWVRERKKKRGLHLVADHPRN